MSASILSRASLKKSIMEHSRVVYALMLRDIKTRAGASYFGYLISVLFPLAHIAILIVIYGLFGRQDPLGTDLLTFMATGILPFIIWSYTHQKIIVSFSQNKPLTSFPIVKFIDIFIARSFVEAMTATLITSVTLMAILVFGRELFIDNIYGFFFSILLAYLLGTTTGLIFGILSLLSTFFTIAGYITIPLYWATCGLFFVADGLPDVARSALAVMPVAHLVDFARESFYSSYTSSFHNLWYVVTVIAINLLSGLTIERFLRSKLTSK